MRKIYDFEPKRYYDHTTGVSRISYFNVALGAYIKVKARELLDTTERLPHDLKRVFLKSFFDDEGCMDFRQKRNLRRVRGYQKNIAILSIIRRVLSDFEINSSIKRPNEITIVGKENLLKFRKEIDFSQGVRINGKRSNSLWKHSFEKRELLRRAIASYKN